MIRAASVLIFLTVATAAVPVAGQERSREAPVVRPGDPSRHVQELVDRARRLDADGRHSRSAAWRAIMSWSTPGDTLFTWSNDALDEAEGRYPTPTGRSDPAADFTASLVLAWTRDDFSCHYPLRARFLARRGLLKRPLALDQRRCPVFEAWAALEHIEGAELMFATPSWSEPSATAGHLLIQFRWKRGAVVTRTQSERVLAYAVDLDAPGANDWRVFKGLTGILRGELLAYDSAGVVRVYNTLQRRDTWVYDIVLNQQELRDLLAVLWVQRRAPTKIPYTFFSVNCARITYDTLRSVVPGLPKRAGWFVHPHGVVSALVAQGRLAPRGVRLSRRSLAREGELVRERLAPELALVPGFGALYDSRWGTEEERARGLVAFAATLRPATLPVGARDALTAYVDATLDIEHHALDAGPDGVDDSVVGPAFHAALDLRAQLPQGEVPRLRPFPAYAISRSGSWRTRLRAGVSDGAVLHLGGAVVDEQPGESRVIALRRSSRVEFLAPELEVGLHSDRPRIRRARLTLASTIQYGSHVRTTEGWFSSRLGLALEAAVESLPEEGVPFGGTGRLGQALTLWHSDDDTGIWAVGADVWLASWVADDDALRGGAGAWTELALPLWRGAHHLRMSGRAAPGANLAGFVLEMEARAQLDLLVSGEQGLMFGPYVGVHRGYLRADAWNAGVGLSF